jgi:rhodanese-related sulfurtransferase
MRTKILMSFIVILIAASAMAFMSKNAKDQVLTSALYKTGIKVIDIRTEGEWIQTGIVKGSYTLTFFDEKGNYNAAKFLAGLKKIVRPDETFGIICRTGNRTTTVSKFLRKTGFPNVINLKGGVTTSVKKGVPFEKYKRGR